MREFEAKVEKRVTNWSSEMKLSKIKSVPTGFVWSKSFMRERTDLKLININGRNPLVLDPIRPKDERTKKILSVILRESDFVRWKDEFIHERSHSEKKQIYSRGSAANRLRAKRKRMLQGVWAVENLQPLWFVSELPGWWDKASYFGCQLLKFTSAMT